VYLGNGDGSFQSPKLQPTQTAPPMLAIIDANSDGKPDVLLTDCCGLSEGSFLLGNGDGTFQPEVRVPSGPSPRWVAIADFNDDGKPDAAVIGQVLEPDRGTLAVVLDVLDVLNAFSTATSGTGSPTNMTANTSTTPQSAHAGSAFANALAVTVTDTNSNPVSGVSVTFTAPSIGASGAFQGSGSTFMTATNSSGIATAPIFTAVGALGAFTVTATSSGLPTVNFSLTNTPVPASRTFVGTTGNDANNCSAGAPCRTLAAALSATLAGGEIVIVSSGGYGSATISQPVVITADEIVASISTTTAGANGLTIATSGNVTLNGLSLHGESAGNDGILINQVGILRLYNLLIENFTNDGIHFATSGDLSLYNSMINDNAHDGLLLANASANAYAHASGFDDNKHAAVEVSAGQAAIADSSAHYNLNAFLADGGTVSLYNDRAIFNGTALASSNGGKLYFAGCLISHNTTGYNIGSGSTMAGSSPGSSLIAPGQAKVGSLSTATTSR
jgi:hypothetical protein